MYKYTLLILAFFAVAFPCDVDASTNFITIHGEVRDSRTKEAIVGASVIVSGDYLWATTDKNGCFTIRNIDGAGELNISHLGYVSGVSTFADGDSKVVIYLQPSSLAIDEVVVIAQNKNSEVNTSYVIGREAIKHTQITTHHLHTTHMYSPTATQCLRHPRLRLTRK
ncbi:MAG: carboxypeptidase-like regulatory domain-containing protein [Rikenellaceae bacterium]